MTFLNYIHSCGGTLFQTGVYSSEKNSPLLCDAIAQLNKKMPGFRSEYYSICYIGMYDDWLKNRCCRDEFL